MAINTKTTSVPVKAPYLSKVNWIQVVAGVAGEATLFVSSMPDAEKLKYTGVILAVQAIATIIVKTFFTSSVSSLTVSGK